MKTKNKHPPVVYRPFRHLNLLDFGFEKPVKKYFKSFIKGSKTNINENELTKFIELTYNYSRNTLELYSSRYSKRLYSQPALFTILALKIYLKTTYRKITEFIDMSSRLKQFLSIRKAPNYSTLQKFFKRIPTSLFHEINEMIIEKMNINPEIIAMDGSGFSSDNADKYYSLIRKNGYRKYTKSHITIDTDSRIILYSQAVNGPRNDMKFAFAATRAIKKYRPSYILADKAYDSEKLRECINEEIKAEDQIPTKKVVKKGKYRKKSKKKFKQKIYNKRSHVESVFSIIKRKFGGINKSKSVRLQNKETQFKTTAYNITQQIKISK